MLKKSFSQGLALAVMLGVSNFAYAAPVSYDFSEVVISASRMDLNLKELPQSAEVITKEEIKQIGATNVKEALRLSPSLVISEAAGTGNAMTLRGSKDVLILLNGRRLPNEDRDDYRLDRFNVKNIERIEILRGPSGALYGSDALGGVINIVTVAPQEEGATVGVATGTREMSNYYRFDSGKLGKLSASLAADFVKVRPFKWADAGMSKASGPRQNFNLDVDYEMDENNKLRFAAEYENDDRTTKNAKTGKVSAHERERKSYAVGYEGKSDKSNYSLDVSGSDLDRPDKDRTYQTFNVDARNTVRSTDELTLTYGGGLRRDTNSVKVSGMSHTEDIDTDQWDAYLYGEYKLSDKLILIPSVRYDHHDSFGSHTSPNLGMTYYARENSRIKASYGSAYRAPTPFELYGAGMEIMNGSGVMVEASPNLKPETSKGIELAWEREFDDVTSMKAAYFNNDKKDAISLENMVVDEDIYKYVNIGKASYEGFEYSLARDLGNGFNASFNYEYLDARDKSDNTRMNYTARNTYTVKLQWVEPEEQEWAVTLWNRWLSDYRTVDNTLEKEVDKSINTFNVAVSKSWEDNKYNAFAALDNVFDKKSDPMRYSGRVWRVGAEVRF